MANPLRGRLRRALRHHQRPPDPVEESDRPFEDKAPDDAPEPGPAREPGSAQPSEAEHDPHHRLNRPARDPDPTSDSDPYEGAS